MADENEMAKPQAAPAKKTIAEELEAFWSKHVRNSAISRDTRQYSKLNALKDQMVKLMGDK